MRETREKRRLVGVWVVMLMLLLGGVFQVASEERPAIAAVGPSLEEMLQEYVAKGYAPSAAAFLIEGEERHLALAGDPMPSEESLFQIGSVTKSFTGLLLAQAVVNDAVTLETTLGEIFEDTLSLDPTVATISLVELATHSSGLPVIDSRAQLGALTHPLNPYRNTKREDIYEALRGLEGEDLRSRGAFAYSNLGTAILGLALEVALDEEYQELVSAEILVPLEMKATGFSGRVSEMTIGGHRANQRPTGDWELGAYDPAGGLLSNPADMELFLRAQLQGDWEPVALSQEVHFRDRERDLGVGLGVIIEEVNGRRMIWHNGQTGGYFAWFGVLPEEGRALVMLTNGAINNDVGRRLLLGEREIPDLPVNPWFLWLTLIGVFYLPLPLAFRLWKHRRWQGAPKEERGARREQAGGRLQVLSEGLGVALLAMILWKFGSWQALAIAHWWVSVSLAAVMWGWLLWEARRMPWMVETGGRKFGLFLGLGFVLFGLLLVGWVWR